MHGLMNNTKWREVFSILVNESVYIQLKLLGDLDYHIDYELSDVVISNINESQFTYVMKEISYADIVSVRICKVAQNSNLDAVKHTLRKVGQLELIEDDQGITVLGYK